MIAIGLILSIFGIGFLCWLLFTLAVYAVSFFAGVMAGLTAFHNDAVIGAIVVGLVAGGLTLGAGQIAFSVIKAPLIRAAIALLFAAPAAIAGYHATLGLAHIGVPSGAWGHVFAVVGSILVGGTAWARITLAEPLAIDRPVRQS